MKPYCVPPVCAEGAAGPSLLYRTPPVLDPLLLPPPLLQWTRHFCGFRCRLHAHHTSPPSPSISAFLQQHLSWHLKLNATPVAGVTAPYHTPDLPDLLASIEFLEPENLGFCLASSFHTPFSQPPPSPINCAPKEPPPAHKGHRTVSPAILYISNMLRHTPNEQGRGEGALPATPGPRLPCHLVQIHQQRAFPQTQPRLPPQAWALADLHPNCPSSDPAVWRLRPQCTRAAPPQSPISRRTLASTAPITMQRHLCLPISHHLD